MFFFVTAQFVQENNNLGDISGGTNVIASITGIKTSLIVMVIWVIIVTVALVVVGVLSFRKWRRDYFAGDGGSITTGTHTSASGDFNDLGSDLGTIVESRLGNRNGGGLSNTGYETDEDMPSIQVNMDQASTLGGSLISLPDSLNFDSSIEPTPSLEVGSSQAANIDQPSLRL